MSYNIFWTWPDDKLPEARETKRARANPKELWLGGAKNRTAPQHRAKLCPRDRLGCFFISSPFLRDSTGFWKGQWAHTTDLDDVKYVFVDGPLFRECWSAAFGNLKFLEVSTCGGLRTNCRRQVRVLLVGGKRHFDSVKSPQGR